MTFQDRWTRYHNELCVNGSPSSNNGWIFSAYAKKLGLAMDEGKLGICFEGCNRWVYGKRILTRHPATEKDTVPISRDEILGMAYLGFLTPSHLNGWSFSPYPIPEFNLKTLVKQILEARGQHRNYFWKNELQQLYRFAFAVPLTDRAFVAEHTGMKLNFVSKIFYKLIAKVDSMLSKESAIRWLKYGKSLKGMQKEFMEGHPFRSF